MAPIRIPGIEYAAMPRAGTRTAALAWPPRWIVIHDTGNNSSTRYDEASYAATRTDSSSNWTSAQVYVDRGGPLGSLPLNLQAWAAYSEANAHGVHIEMCRESNGVVHPDTIRHTTEVVRTLLGLGAAAPVKLSPADVAAHKPGICGHRDITLGLHVGDHEDPGASFDWASFMAQVNGGDDMLKDEKIVSTSTPGMGDRDAATLLSDIWNVVMRGRTQGGDLWGDSPFAKLLAAAARPALDAATVAAALAPLLTDHLGVEVSQDQLVAALNSDAGQAALVKAANAAEDS